MRTSWLFRLLFISSLPVVPCLGLEPAGEGYPLEEATATVHGRVEFAGPRRLLVYDDSIYAYLPPRISIADGGGRRAVVYLDDLEGKLPPSEERSVKIIDQKNETFLPRYLAVEAGTRVDFPNSDSIYHNVFSLSKPKRFDLGRYPRGESRSVVFDQVGIVRIFCEIHSHMSAFVIVLPHAFFDTTDESGDYRIPAVPPGRYRVVVWSDEFRSSASEIQLRPGEDLRVDFRLEDSR